MSTLCQKHKNSAVLQELKGLEAISDSFKNKGLSGGTDERHLYTQGF